jgi:predicted ferric reductase
MLNDLLNITIIHDLRTQVYQQRVISDVMLLTLIVIVSLLCVTSGIRASLDGRRVLMVVNFIFVGINGMNGVWTIVGMIKRRRAYKEEVANFQKCRANLLEMIKMEQKVVIEDGENENRSGSSN